MANEAAAVIRMTDKRWNQNLRPETDGHYVVGTLRNNAALATRILAIRDLWKITTLVEGGTYHGESTAWAAERFSRVVTIDVSAEDQAVARARCESYSNVTFILGSVWSCLPEVIGGLAGPAIFLFDHHYSVRDHLNQTDELIHELELIFAAAHRHFVFINDARCFTVAGAEDRGIDSRIYAVAYKGGYLVGEEHNMIVLLPTG